MKIESDIKYSICDLNSDEIEVIIRALSMFDCYNEESELNGVADDLSSNIKCSCGYIS